VIYQSPLASLLGLEGVALLRAFFGEHDREFCEARIGEIRRLLDAPALGEWVAAQPVDTVEGYGAWSQTYDQPGNGLFRYEEPIMHEILNSLPRGVALDAACGTGRHTEYLAGHGYRVIGVDSSPDMLAHASVRVPQAEFHQADLDNLSLPDDHVDLVVCSLALSHLPDLRPPIAEFVRVLRPGGHLVISDSQYGSAPLVTPPRIRIEGRPSMLPGYRHRASDYLAAALPLGLQVRRCDEPRRDEPIQTVDNLDPGPWDDWPWSLLGIVPAAAAAAWADFPALIVWHFQLADQPTDLALPGTTGDVAQ
jgi:SAM-dependent methyltransferase